MIFITPHPRYSISSNGASFSINHFSPPRTEMDLPSSGEREDGVTFLLPSENCSLSSFFTHEDRFLNNGYNPLVVGLTLYRPRDVVYETSAPRVGHFFPVSLASINAVFPTPRSRLRQGCRSVATTSKSDRQSQATRGTSL